MKFIKKKKKLKINFKVSLSLEFDFFQEKLNFFLKFQNNSLYIAFRIQNFVFLNTVRKFELNFEHVKNVEY